MALVIADRVKETTITSGTGAVTLAGAVTGYQAFSAAIGNGNTTYYCIADQAGANWEVGLGTYSSTGNTLTRTTVLSSSNAGAAVNFGSNAKDVFVTLPASKGPLEAGTKTVFFQAAAPTGWTQITDDTATNRMLRVVNTAGGGNGGSHSPILNNVVPSHTHGFTTGNMSQDHVHGGWTGGVNSSHLHGASGQAFIGLTANGTGEMGGIAEGGSFAEQDVFRPSTTGYQNVDHAHYITTGGVSQNHTHSGSTDNGSSQTNWTPRYIDMIICSKN